MGSSAQLFNLGWNDFGQTLKQTVGGLRSHGELVDVTLAADGKTFPAHKIVLSASSPLLLRLLKVTPCQHPVIVLAGVTATDMEVLLDFIYNGEVKVHSDHLPSLLQAARLLDINGLSQGKITPERAEDNSAAEAAFKAAILAAQRPDDRTKDLRPSKRVKRKSSGTGEFSPSNDKWARWDTSGNESTDTEGAPVDRRPSMSFQNYQSSTKPVTEATVTLATLQNVVPGPSWSKTSTAHLHSAAAGHRPSRGALPGDDEIDALRDVPPHHLHDLNADDDDDVGQDESYAAIAAAADAAAVAAATMSEKKGTSEQPVACPFCNFVIKQSRNLRRHLEIKHFGGARPRKHKGRKKAADAKSGANDSGAESNVDASVIEHVQIEMKSPSVNDNLAMAASVEAKSSEAQNFSQSQPATHLQQFAHIGPSILSHHIVPVPSPGPGYAPHHLQLLKGSAHSLIGATGNPTAATAPHFIYAPEGSRPSSHQ